MLDPIIEGTYPFDIAKISTPCTAYVPPDIEALVELLGLRVQCFRFRPTRGMSTTEIPITFWKISTADNAKYVRIDSRTIEQDPAKWRELIGLLMDYANGAIKNDPKNESSEA